MKVVDARSEGRSDTGKRLICAWMTAVPTTVHTSESIAVADERMHRLGVRHLPVVDDAGVVGIVSERDLTVVEGLGGYDPKVMSVASVMQSPVYASRADQAIGQVAREMASRKIGSSVVLDEAGELVGIVTTTDLLRCLARVEEAAVATEGKDDAFRELAAFSRRETPALEAELDSLEAQLRGGFAASRQADRHARQHARDLCDHLLQYYQQEALLVARAAASGPSEVQARMLDRIHAEHRELTKSLKLVVQRLGSYDTEDLAHALLDLLPVFRSQLRQRNESSARID